VYPEVSIATARKKTLAMRRLINARKDPPKPSIALSIPLSLPASLATSIATEESGMSYQQDSYGVESDWY
jgi:hypothetical protein